MRSRRTWRDRIAQARWVLMASVFPAVLAFETTAAELECRGKDISGATSCWSKSSSAALSSFPINLVDLPNAVIGGITHRLRNNSVSHYRVTLNPGDMAGSWLSLQVAGVAFGPRTTRHVEDVETLKGAVRRSIGPTEFDAITRIRDRDRTGWLVTYKRASGILRCYAVAVALEPSAWGAGRTDEVYEMIVRMKDCTGRPTQRQLEDWLHSVRAVADGYNRK